MMMMIVQLCLVELIECYLAVVCDFSLDQTLDLVMVFSELILNDLLVPLPGTIPATEPAATWRSTSKPARRSTLANRVGAVTVSRVPVGPSLPARRSSGNAARSRASLTSM